jgi:hypothetical protein
VTKTAATLTLNRPTCLRGDRNCGLGVFSGVTDVRVCDKKHGFWDWDLDALLGKNDFPELQRFRFVRSAEHTPRRIKNVWRAERLKMLALLSKYSPDRSSLRWLSERADRTWLANVGRLEHFFKLEVLVISSYLLLRAEGSVLLPR